MRYTKQFLILLFTLSYFAAAAQSSGKAKYVGSYQYNINIYTTKDTLSGMAFFTQDSFAIIFQVPVDSDYSYPLFRGTWLVAENDSVELIYDNGTRKTCRFEMDDKYVYFCQDDGRFSRQNW